MATYNVVQVFDAKWQRKSLGPTHNTAYKNVPTIEEAKALAARVLTYPTVAVHLVEIDKHNVARQLAILDSSGEWTYRTN